MTDEETAEVLGVLDAADRGELNLETVGRPWEEVYAGNVEYRVATPEGDWCVVVFNDCDSWDYVDSVTAPDGRSWEYLSEDVSRPMSMDVVNWVPQSVRWGYTYNPPTLVGLIGGLIVLGIYALRKRLGLVFPDSRNVEGT